ncbi:thiolase C-terminal domain-containing protein [Xanthobacter wiegelii]|uniref:thiolase C-terminal domain-containing protein n=1 Tax=Xanthobacter wiegelii TaxID=3119913 RepID=UPI00372BF8A0
MTRSRTLPYAAIAGLGFSVLARTDIGTPRDLAIDAVVAAVRDCGLELSDIDGLILTCSPSAPLNTLPLRLREDLGLGDLTLLGNLQVEGASVVASLQHASLHIQHGMATTVACVFADVPIRPGREKGSTSYNRVMPLSGLGEWEAAYGLYGAAGPYALAAHRYLLRYNLSSSDLGHYAISCRKWARDNPNAFLRDPLESADYLGSPYVVSPFRVLDCAYPVNGAIAVILTACPRAKDLKQPPVFLHAFAQGHPSAGNMAGLEPELRSGGDLASDTLWRDTGMGPEHVEMVQAYDAFSYVGLLTLEEYGFCPRGEAAHFVADGQTSPGGPLPMNTGGGHLSGFYLQGMTPVSEAVIQARGQGAARQSARNNLILITGTGGRLDYHAAMLASPHEVI